MHDLFLRIKKQFDFSLKAPVDRQPAQTYVICSRVEGWKKLDNIYE